MNPRSGCQHKAWGGAQRNPGKQFVEMNSKPAKRATAGGTGIYQDAFGRVENHGTFSFQTGEVSVD